MSEQSVVAVVPAAGIGSRMQADKPKQYLTLAGKTILEHTLHTLYSHPAVDKVVVSINPDDPYFVTLDIAKAHWLTVVNGGETRADSVLAGITTLQDDTWAMVHDAARPCVSHSDIDKLLCVQNRADVAGGILATPVRDTMKRALDGTTEVSHTESRDNLWHALTPQLFKAGALKAALMRCADGEVAITDEASAMEAAGYRVALIDSNPANIKITHPADMPLAAFYFQQLTKQR
ncbi:2-C-methyl-D-erythritol 4-phosphate cytidylyltransferase [Aestuariibacter sp. A3R04]|uniref:2-C-methyl-D-erythritol 4-phosphate cytidylyltransferase n=1 Tax=Aestuariibacter sp. A3R04 TaxID=2841571 RepID=UPI001C0979C9|nr:2-C-methyl-D-erythritol 4-phosphate cytidylyltransferase [Aestuariibacter sp. A3R04]MBU3021139.1 2-C-methyl-D-erythritol 4-phosphate cytidylyltransferase [Aestuariibacter sp. A3R04]